MPAFVSSIGTMSGSTQVKWYDQGAGQFVDHTYPPDFTCPGWPFALGQSLPEVVPPSGTPAPDAAAAPATEPAAKPAESVDPAAPPAVASEQPPLVLPGQEKKVEESKKK